MLQVFRDNLKKLAWILWVVIAVFVLLVFADFRSTNNPSSPDSTAATIGDREISFREFEQQYRSYEDRLRAAYGDAYNADLARQLGVPMQAMSALISQKIMLDEARRMGLEPTEEEIRQAILQVPALQDENGNFIGAENYRRVLQANRIPVDRFEQSMRDQVLLEKLNDVLSQTVWISDRDVERHAREQAEKATISFVELTAAQLAAEPIEVSDDDLAAYYDEHRGDYQLPERRAVAYLSVNINTVRASIEISDEELQRYYDENEQEFTREEQVRAQHILLFVNAERTAEEARATLEDLKRQLENGADFNQLAAQYSEDEATKDRGGDLGFFGRGRMTPQFEEAAFSAAPGEIVGPIENQLGPRTGYHLIKVISRQEGGKQPFDQVSNRIRVRLLNERARDRAEQLAEEIYEKIRNEPITGAEQLQQIAEQEGVALETTEPFARDDNVPRIGRNTAFTERAFELEPGQVSEPIRIGAGWALLSVLSIEEPRLPELAEVIEKVREDVTAIRRKELALERLRRAREEINAGKSFADVVAALGLEPRSAGPFGVRGSIPGLSSSAAVVRAALELETGEVGGPVATSQGAVLFEVTAREHFDPSAFEGEKELLRDQLASQQFNALLASLIEKRRAELDVTYSRQFIESFQLDQPATVPGA